jgi:probable RNA-binding protein EIF1AD
LNEFPVPEKDDSVVRVTELRGGNMCEVEQPDGRRLLVQIPMRFRKLIWIRRGSYLIVREPPELVDLDNVKVKALVQTILFPTQIEYIKKQKMW